MASISAPPRAPLAVAASFALLAGPGLQAQTPQTPAPAELPAVTVTGERPGSRASVTGFGEQALAETPLQARSLTLERLKEAGVQRLSDLSAFDAGISDSYNAEGYWDNFSVRGYALDPRQNYRRDGLPISAETSIPLDNKASVELLKGTSGIQAGTSAPGGLVNLSVKRPEGHVRSLSFGWRSRGTRGASLDVGERFGAGQAFGLRVNAAYEDLDPPLHSAHGHRRLLAVAGDWRVSPDTLIEAEFETSRRSQPSQPGFSLLGDTVPRAGDIDPRTNLNNQPWSLPVVMDAHTASLRLQQRLDADWRFSAHLGTQRLRTDDRLAFPFGCSAEAGTYYADRYCPGGEFDLYEYRSDGERRRTHALDLALHGRLRTGPLRHSLSTGVLFTRHKSRFGAQTYDFAGIGTIDGRTLLPPSAGGSLPNTDRTERSTEWYLRDQVALAPDWTAWLGLRHTRLRRASESTDPADPQATRYRQSLTTPWLALSHQLAPGHTVYGSWGEGIESRVVPNRPGYANAGEALPALRSRQLELGYKAQAGRDLQWSLSYFRIRRPEASDTGSAYFIDGSSLHRGFEAAAEARIDAWTLAGSAMWLHARRQDSTDPRLNGRRPANVPDFTAKAEARYRVAALPGLQLLGAAVHESDRQVLPGSGQRIPSWTRFDLGLVHEHPWGGTLLTVRAGVENVGDKRAWRESPFQYGHAYLYPLAPRTWRLSLQLDL